MEKSPRDKSFCPELKRIEKAFSSSTSAIDHISGLPDAVLISILSMLSLRDAVKTCVLSRRWKYLWKCIYNVHFNMDEVLGLGTHLDQYIDIHMPDCETSILKRMHESIGAIDWLLRFRHGCHIEKLSLHICSSQFFNNLTSWTLPAIRSHVQRLEFNFSGAASPYPFPYHLVMAESVPAMKCLCLNFCILQVTDGFNCLGSLTSLTLDRVRLTDNLTISCPLLEELVIRNCDGIHNLSIGCPPLRLKHLKILSKGKKLEVYAKNLVHFEFFGFQEAVLRPFPDRKGHLNSPLSSEPFIRRDSACSLYTPDPSFGGFKLLDTVVLHGVGFTTERIKNLLSNCSTLEHFTLDNCDMRLAANTLKISGTRLKYVKVYKCCGVMAVHVCACNLERFEFLSSYSFVHESSMLALLDDNGSEFSVAGRASLLKFLYLQSIKLPRNSFCNFCSLEEVILEDMPLKDMHLSDFLSNCLLLKRLHLIGCCNLFTLRIVGTSLLLEELTVHRCDHLLVVRISSRNLVSFDYDGPAIKFSIEEASELTRVEMRIAEGGLGSRNSRNENLLSLLLNLSSLPKLRELSLYVKDVDVPQSLPKFASLKQLVLFGGEDPKLTQFLTCVTSLLMASPFLEILRVVLPHYPGDQSDEGKASSLAWSSHHQHVKVVELYGFRGLEEEINFAMSVLRNSQALELLRIDPLVKLGMGYGGPHVIEWELHGRQRVQQLLNGQIPPHAQLLIL